MPLSAEGVEHVWSGGVLCIGPSWSRGVRLLAGVLRQWCNVNGACPGHWLGLNFDVVLWGPSFAFRKR